jgi:hypothetical protein
MLAALDYRHSIIESSANYMPSLVFTGLIGVGRGFLKTQDARIAAIREAKTKQTGM